MRLDFGHLQSRRFFQPSYEDSHIWCLVFGTRLQKWNAQFLSFEWNTSEIHLKRTVSVYWMKYIGNTSETRACLLNEIHQKYIWKSQFLAFEWNTSEWQKLRSVTNTILLVYHLQIWQIWLVNCMSALFQWDPKVQVERRGNV